MNRRVNLPGLPQLILPRPHLIQRLAQTGNCKLTLVSAPPGYGKTTLIVQFAHQTNEVVLWHSVQEQERDVVNLHQRCLSILSQEFPDVEAVSYRTEMGAAEQAARLNEVLSHQSASERIFYVLDDAHHLLGSPTSESWLRTWIATLPSFLHVILITRAVPTLPMTEMIARREMLAIGQEELAFSPEETEILAGQTQVHLETTEMKAAISRLQGWPAGTVLALQPLPASIETNALEGNGPEALFDALARRALAAQSPLFQDFLLAASTLTRITPERCQNILGLRGSMKHIAEARNRNFFLTPVPGGLAFHPLFREFLQGYLKLHAPARFRQLHQQAGSWFEAHPDALDTAFEHYLAADSLAQASGIAERVAQPYYAQGRAETLLHWEQLLGAAASLSPTLVYTCAMIHTNRYQYEVAQIELKQAEAGFQNKGDAMGWMKVHLLRAFIANQRGQPVQAQQQAEMLLKRADIPSNLRGWALDILGLSHLEQGNPNLAIQHFQAALPLYKAVGDTHATSQLLQNMELAYSRYGQFEEAGHCLQEVVTIRQALGGVMGLGLALNNLGYHHHQRGNYRLALETFQEGLSVASRSPEPRVESYLRWSLGDLQRDRGLFGEAAQLYHKALELIGDREPVLRCGLLFSLSTLRRWQGRYEEAALLAQDERTLAEEHNLGMEQAKAELALYAASLFQVHAQSSVERLHGLIQQFTMLRSYNRLAQTLAIAACAALLQSDTAAAQTYVQQVLQKIPHPANRQPLIAEIQHTPILRAWLESAPTRYPLLVKELKGLQDHLQADETRDSIQLYHQQTYTLRVFTLGQERIESECIPGRWPSAAARDLFFYLLLMGPSTRDQMCLRLWPDYSPQQVRRNFHVSLYRARQVVGENTILYQDERYLLNPNLDIWLDADELENLVKQAQPLPPRGAYTESLWKRAVDLYQGEFLPTVDTEWVAARRERLQEAYLQACVGLGNCARARGQYAEAIVHYKRTLIVDPYREDIHCLILTAYAEQGQRQQVLQHWNELKTLLRRELALEPAPETRHLAQTLLA
jgi:LuxR family maltose regulon positive regulatory protein